MELFMTLYPPYRKGEKESRTGIVLQIITSQASYYHKLHGRMTIYPNLRLSEPVIIANLN
jgi:hypothetical protein